MTDDKTERALNELNDLKDLDMSIFSDDDEEMTEQPVAPPPQINQLNSLDSPIHLYRMYYQHWFPYKHYFYWLNYDTLPTKNFTHREFSFTLNGDIYVRFRSFNTGMELKKEIERLQPLKIDIGAIYSIKPRLKKTVSEKAFKALEKELVFDIDMTDYDDIRTCCRGGDLCPRCWPFMVIAMEILDTSLREDFGFMHLLWVYSGRRGVHCWVCDDRARALTNESRQAIVRFLEVVKGGAEVARKVRLPAVLHPSLQRSYEILSKYFYSFILNEQGVLDTPEEWKKVLAIIPDEEVQAKLDESWTRRHKSPDEKWEELTMELDKQKRWKHVSRDIMFQYCYPRLDSKVSTQTAHLLKSPFSVHPKTLKVSVPIPKEMWHDFDPDNAPNLKQLRQDLIDQNISLANTSVNTKIGSLGQYINHFEKFVVKLLIDTKRYKKDQANQSMEF
ncbi:DNA primase catalytic subunit [Pilobolus umbonatus]|nr:DNA primase catalytic subunit [Pilobolus umbonatus]